MDDIRVEWMRDSLFYSLKIDDNSVFEEFYDRNDGENERELAKFLNETPDEQLQALLFYKSVVEEEEEVEVECGKFILFNSHN